jgi:hypothetical protein
MVFLKYFSAMTIVSAICLHALNIHPLNVIIHLIGACTWSVVGFAWKEKSIILNFPSSGFHSWGRLNLHKFLLISLYPCQ